MNNKQVSMLDLNILKCRKLPMTKKPASSSIYWRKMTLMTQSICCWLIIMKLTATTLAITAASLWSS